MTSLNLITVNSLTEIENVPVVTVGRKKREIQLNATVNGDTLFNATLVFNRTIPEINTTDIESAIVYGEENGLLFNNPSKNKFEKPLKFVPGLGFRILC